MGNLVNDLYTTAIAPLASTSHTRAQSLLSGPGFNTTIANGQQATSVAYGAPADAVSLPLVQGNAVHANFDIAGANGDYTTNNSTQVSSDVFGVGVLGGSYSANGSGAVRTYTSTADFDVDNSLLQTGAQNLLVGFMNPVINDADFDDPDFSVRFRVTREGVNVVDQTFTDAAAARSYFEGATLDLGSTTNAVTGDLDLNFRMDVTGDNPNAGIAVDYVVGNSTVTQRAVPFVPDTVLNIADSHVGDVAQQGVEVVNVAVAGSDGANAQFIGTGGDGVHDSGSIANLAPGGSDNTSMMAGIDTSTAGAKSGSATIELSTDGVVTGTAEVFGTANVNVSGNVYRLAEPSAHSPEPVVLANVRVGEVSQTALTLSNDAVNDGFSEALNANFTGTTGDANATGAIVQLAAGGSDNSSLVVGINTSTAGAKSGTAALALESDGDGINSLGQTALAGQTVNVSGNVYRLAQAGAHTPEPVVLADSHVGDSAQLTLSMSNTAANDGFSESLSANIGGATGDASASGAFNLLGAGQTDSSNLVVGINTSTAGAKSGTATISSESDGSGTSNIVGNVALADQTVNISGNVYRLAEASAHTPEPVVLGDVHVGGVSQAALTIGNTAVADSFSENLNASLGATTGAATASGSVTGLIAGASDNSSLIVGIDTTTAGAKSGTAALGLVSDGAGINSLGQTALADQTVNVSGNVYRLAEASAHSPEPVVLGNVHVGDLSQAALTISNTAATDGFSENLNASLGSTTGDATASGSFSGLAAGGSDSSSLVVGIDTSTAGAKTGTAALGLESDGDGINSLGQTALAGQTVNISGNVYRLAQATVDNPLAFAFGNVHVGDSASQAVSLTNSATADAFSESLNASFGSASDARIQNNGGSVGQLAAGDTDNSAMVVTVDTSAAGNVSGTQTLNFASDGTGTSGLGITGLPSQDLNVSASITAGVYRLANPLVNNAQPLAFGNFREGDAVTSQALSITNNVPNDGFSESLNGSVGGTSGGVTTNGGLFNLLAAAGTDNSAISVAIDTSTAGDKAGNATLDFISDGTGTSGLGQTPLASQDVAVTGQVFRLAQMDATPPIVTLNARVGDTASQGLSIANTATNDGFSEQLSVTGRTDAGDVTSSGMIGGLINAGTSDTGVSVALDTSSAGAKSGSVTFSGESDGTNTSGFTTNVSLTDQTVNVSGNVYRLAEASAHSPEPVVLGNVHVGDLSQAALTISNTAATDGFSENLNASLGSTTGDATASGSFSGLAAGGSDSSSLVVGIDTSTAGAKTGTAALGLESDGDGINSLGQTALAGQTVNISGNVYRLAQATVDNPLAFAFGNVHVGDSASQAVSLTNSATADAFSESLNASFGSASDARIQNNGGSVGQLAAGDTDNSAMVVTVDTSAAGNVSGTQTLNFASDGTGTSGLGITGLPSQDLNVSASITAGVYRLANPLVNNAQPLAFGNFREGDAVTSQALSITNNVPNDGFSESLNGSVGGTSGGVTTNGGLFNLLAAAGTDNSAISVAIDTSTAGDKAGNATLDFISDGTGTSGLGQTPLASQDVAVTGQVFRLAQMDATPPIVTLNARVGDTASQGLSIANTATNDGFSEQLSVTGRTDAGDVTSSGMIGGLINAGTSDTGVSVALDTSSAGAKSGSVTFSGESDGTNTSGFTTNVSLADQVVNVVGNVYTAAVAQVTDTLVDFGIVHVGDSVAQQAIAVTNIAASSALNDVLQGSFAGASGSFSSTGDLGLGLDSGDSASVFAGLDTSTAGIFSDTATISLASHNADMADLALSDVTVGLQAQVNEYANPVFDFISGDGSLTSSSNTLFELDFGTIVLGSGLFTANLGVLNDVAAPADLLAGLFDLTNAGVFGLLGFDDFGFSGPGVFDSLTALGALDLLGGMEVSFDSSSLGLGNYTGSILLNPFGFNTSGYDGAFDEAKLVFTASIVDGASVPEPGVLVLFISGSLLVLVFGRRRKQIK